MEKVGGLKALSRDTVSIAMEMGWGLGREEKGSNFMSGGEKEDVSDLGEEASACSTCEERVIEVPHGQQSEIWKVSWKIIIVGFHEGYFV